MDEKLVNCDLILSWLQGKIERKEPIGPNIYMDACQKLNILVGDESDKLYELQQKVAQIKVDLIERGKSVAEAKTRTEATDEYKEMKKQEAKIERINEAVRISKIQARLRDTELFNQQ